MRIAGVFVGHIDDRGFNARARAGFATLEARHRVTVEGDLPFDPAQVAQAAGRLALGNDLVVLVGGQGDMAAPIAAAAAPQTGFAVIQGSVTGPNLGSVVVLQEQSAFLAGVAAAHLTRSGIVGHLSGHRVKPGLAGRAAFAAGVAHADRGVRLLTGFCGSQDDSALAERWTLAEIDAGADVLFTMLNASRPGAIAAARARGARLIGNVGDWTATEPDVFVGSALARIDFAVIAAVEAFEARTLAGRIARIGLENPLAVGLALGASVPDAVRAAVASAAEALRAGRITTPESYEGPEFSVRDLRAP